MTDEKKCCPKGIIQAMLPAIDSILAVRDAVGAVIEPVALVTRTWTGTAPGEGTATDVVVKMYPTPGMKNFSQDVRLREGGNIKAGDIILKDVSKNLYTFDALDSVTATPNIEKFYLIGVKLYQVINITEKYVTWDVQIRELTNQVRY